METMTQGAAYIRRSYVDAESPGDISLEAQRSAVRRLAAADGHGHELAEYNDWGISADVAKAGQRTAYSRLLADMEAGRVSAVYAFDVDRLYRDPRDLIRLQDAAQAHAVRIVTTGGPLAIGEGDDPAAEAFAFMGSVFGRLELQKIKKRNRAAREARMARGDSMGQPGYGWRHVRDETGRILRVRDPEVDLQPLLNAYNEAGTVLGAVRLLNERGIPSAKGGRWYTSAYTRILEDHWPGLLPRKGASGKRIAGSALLAQLLICHCGTVLTPNKVRKQYWCSRGHVTPGHGRTSISEDRLLPWVIAEAARVRLPDRVQLAEASEGKRPALEARRERIIDNYEDGLVTRAQRDAKLAAVDEELDRLDTAAVVVDVPTINWKAPAEHVNAILRAFWSGVYLDHELRPVRAEWRLPAEYVA